LRIVPIAVAALVVLVALVQSFYTVEADSEAVVLRFGRHVETTGPGLHGKWPFGIERVYVVPVNFVQTQEFGFRTVQPGKRTLYGRPTAEDRALAMMLTGDLNIARVEWTVQYRIKDIEDYLFKVQDVEGTIRDVSESIMRGLVGDRSVDEVITIGRADLAREALLETQKKLDELGCGVELTKLNLQDVRPPDEVKQAFDAVNQARQKKEELINQANAQRNRLVPAARGEREKLIKEAEAYKDRKIREVNGETKAFLDRFAAYREAKDETRLRLYLETMERVLGRAERKIVLDESVRGLLPLLDLGPEKGGTP
jgi:membrane protease subunit HflK